MGIPFADRLPWPREAAQPEPATAADLTLAPSNIALDVHGNPARARLHVYSDGNHHMALAETMEAFLVARPDVEDIFYLTTPPRLSIEALRSGRVRLGNLEISTAPHVLIGPEEILGSLHDQGVIASNTPFMRSAGNVPLFRKGNPKGIEGVSALFRDDVRLALSNPITESASFTIYAADLVAAAPTDAPNGGWQAWLESDAVVKSRVIHHREIPELLALDAADVSLIYRHLGLRYARVFPDVFEIGDIVDPANTTRYHVGLIGDGGPFGREFAEHLQSSEVAAIYRSHGLAALDDPLV
ncbi:MAG: substrate-binding domain-containing protein [Pseudomonadota bacterium]